MHARPFIAVATLLAVFAPAFAGAGPAPSGRPFSGPAFSGTVTRVVDGDTIHIGHTKVRLWGINTPEHDECGFKAARAGMQALAFGKTAQCHTMDTDAFGRTVAVCTVNGTNIGRKMVLEGLSKDYTHYSHGGYLFEENTARMAATGLWKSCWRRGG